MSLRIDHSPRPAVSSPDYQLNLVQAPRGIGDARSSIAASAVEPDSSDCCSSIIDALTYIPRAVGNFFYYQYVDLRMFIKAFFSMGGGSTFEDIQRRQLELNRFVFAVDSLFSSGNEDQRARVAQAFERLSFNVQDLFYIVDHDYIRRFSTCGNDELIEMRDEMMREAVKAEHFQSQLSHVNRYYTFFQGLRSGQNFPDLISSFVHAVMDSSDASTDDQIPEEPSNNRPAHVPAPRPSARPGAIPNTVPYDNGNIPGDVQRKADEIERLKGELNIPDDQIPDGFNCTILTDIMSIPVFDKSHPQITEATVGNRAFRHIIDRTSLEGIYNSGRSVRCPICCHDTQRRNLLIDTGLQDEILAFLRGRRPANP